MQDLSEEESTALQNLIAKLFIARTDVKAIQASNGAYYTHVSNPGKQPPAYIPWSRAAIADHLSGRETYGHYLLDKSSESKLFAFDIDLDTSGKLPTMSFDDVLNESDVMDFEQSFEQDNPREAWKNRSHIARSYIKYVLKSLAGHLYGAVRDIGLPAAVAYTGNKGLHVYGFTGKMPADAVREAALLAAENLDLREYRGHAFYKAYDLPEWDILTVEVFPKQDHIPEEGFGNLMRLPLGKNKKSKDPTFFLDMEHKPLVDFAPISALEVLTQAESILNS